MGITDDVKQYVDLQSAICRLRSKSAYKKLLEIFVHSKEIDSLNKSYHENDYVNIASSIHTIKGISGNLSLAKLYDSSVELEEKLKKSDLKCEDIEAYNLIWLKTNENIDIVLEYLNDNGKSL